MPPAAHLQCTVAVILLLVAAGNALAIEPAFTAAVPEPGYLGVLAADAGETGGALLMEVTPNSPAALSGLRAGDVVVACNGQPIPGAADFIAALSGYGPGSSLTFRVMQSGFSKDVETILGTRPAPPQRRFPEFGRISSAGHAPRWTTVRPTTLLEDRSPLEWRLGIRTQLASQAALARRRLPERPGVLVSRVERDSPADLAGVRLGCLIIAVDGAEVASPQALTKAFSAAGESIDVTCVGGGEEHICRIERPQ